MHVASGMLARGEYVLNGKQQWGSCQRPVSVPARQWGAMVGFSRPGFATNFSWWSRGGQIAFPLGTEPALAGLREIRRQSRLKPAHTESVSERLSSTD